MCSLSRPLALSSGSQCVCCHHLQQRWWWSKFKCAQLPHSLLTTFICSYFDSRPIAFTLPYTTRNMHKIQIVILYKNRDRYKLQQYATSRTPPFWMSLVHSRPLFTVLCPVYEQLLLVNMQDILYVQPAINLNS